MAKFKIGIECESIEGKNPMFGVGKMIVKLLEEISRRPELSRLLRQSRESSTESGQNNRGSSIPSESGEKNYRFILYFKDKVPDLAYLKSPIFEIRRVPVPFFKNRLFPIYYFALLPMRLWFERLDLMFWPNYMLPIIAFGKSLVVLTEDVYYETHEGRLPFRYRLAYRIFCWWTARFATKILAISETSKKNLVKLYGIKPERIVVNYLGVDSLLKDQSPKSKALDLSPSTLSYILFVGQMFPRRHAIETILAFEKLTTEYPNILQSSFDRLPRPGFARVPLGEKHGQETTPRQNVGMSELRLVVIGPDKYGTPIIEHLVSKTNERLGREAVTHKDYVTNEELTELYAGAKALIYVSDREAFGLPPMEALSFGVPPVIADNELGHELFNDYAFYVNDPSPEGIADGIGRALTDSEKIQKIKKTGPEFVKKYGWKSFTDKFLKIINN